MPMFSSIIHVHLLRNGHTHMVNNSNIYLIRIVQVGSSIFICLTVRAIEVGAEANTRIEIDVIGNAYYAW